ncbi:MAG: 2-polyprenylphenol 6-hydroxylase, partial [Proteobacteria bacterium]|nr:2-polyprenylphenol 6-hydroxylase [Pseudomonadota bacterium]
MHLFRLLRIVYLFAYYAQPIANRKKGSGKRLARSLYHMGPAYIKFGQALSIRSDILGEQIADELGVLRDSLPPFPFKKVKKIIEQGLGKPLFELYSDFDEEAVAAASIAQVHFAVTADGEEVAVKVLRPEVEKIFARDVAMMRWLAKCAEKLSKEARRLKLRQVVEEFAKSVAVELDLRMEAAAASELKENFAGEVGFHVPRVDWRRTS